MSISGLNMRLSRLENAFSSNERFVSKDIENMNKLENNILLSKTSVFESVNRTIFTVVGVVLGLLVSTGTNLYINESYKQFIKMIALAILLLIIIYSAFNVTDYKNFIERFNASESNVYNMYTEGKIIIQYIFIVLLAFIFITNIMIMV
jgi:SNF family Na+-dependent transporter